MGKCIVCLTDKNLNTHMKIDIDNESYKIFLCDEHSESTTMGSIQKKVRDIRDKLRNAVKLARDLGINIPEIEQCSPPNPPEFEGLTESMETPIQEGSPYPPLGTQETQGTQQEVQIQPKKIIKPKKIQLSETESINQDEYIETQSLNIRGGTVVIPKKTNGESGSTDINIVSTNDKMIQDRAKSLNHAIEHGQTNIYSGACLACKGIGTHPITKQTCPRCKGTGMMI